MSVDLAAQQVIGGVIRVSRSASTVQETYVWPDGSSTHVKRFVETTVVMKHKGMECHVYTRGSDEHAQFLESLDEHKKLVEEAKKKASVDAEQALAKRLAEVGLIVGDKAHVDTQESLISDVETDGSDAVKPFGNLETHCEQPPPHFDCKMCANPDGEDRHFTSPRALQSHNGTRAHKDMLAAVGELKPV